MENKSDITPKKKNIRTLNYKAIAIILFGIILRIIMLFYYYWSNAYNPYWNWGDIYAFFITNRESPPLSIILLYIFRFLSFGYIEIFVFWAFSLDLVVCSLFYFVLKKFNVKDINRAFGLFLINLYFFLNNSFSLEMCGYNIVDSFFFLSLFFAFIFSNGEEFRDRCLFYIFLGLSMCIKYYTLPALGFLFVKYLFEKNWKEMRIFMLCVIPLILAFLIFPLLFLDSYRAAVFNYPTLGGTPLLIRVIPMGVIFLLYSIFRLKNAKLYEIIIVSTIATATFLFFSYTYVRWFQFMIFYGILTQKEFSTLKLNLGVIKRDIKIDNHLLTFYFSFIGVFLAFIFIILGLS